MEQRLRLINNMLKKINNYHLFILILIVFILNTILFKSIDITKAQWQPPSDIPGQSTANIVTNPLQEDLDLGGQSIIGDGSISANRISISEDDKGFIQSDGYDHTELAQRSWSGSHGLLFGATTPSSWVDGSLLTTGNIQYTHDAGTYGRGAAGLFYYNNGGNLYLSIAPQSTGAGDNITGWKHILQGSRDGTVSFNAGDVNMGNNLNVGGDIECTDCIDSGEIADGAVSMSCTTSGQVNVDVAPYSISYVEGNPCASGYVPISANCTSGWYDLRLTFSKVTAEAALCRFYNEGASTRTISAATMCCKLTM